MKIFDISRPLFNSLAPWPGDTAFHFELKWKMAEGATVNVGAVTMGVHNGSHADAPFHFEQGADTIERMRLEPYFGEAVVVDLTAKFETDRSRQITIADLESSPETPRLLLKTGGWRGSESFSGVRPVV